MEAWTVHWVTEWREEKKKEKKLDTKLSEMSHCHFFFVFDMESWIERVADYRGLILNSQMTVSSEA